MAITHLLWDWNGTLFDDLDLCIRTINGILLRENLPPVTKAAYREKFRFPIIDYYRDLGLDVSGDNFPRLAREYMAAYQPGSASCSLAPDAEATLRAARALGLKQIILSASKIGHLERQVAERGIRGYFHELVGLDNIHAASKLDAALAWQRESGVPGERILMAGDTYHDFEVARALGATFVHYAGGHQTVEAKSIAPHAQVNALAEIQAYLGRIG